MSASLKDCAPTPLRMSRAAIECAGKRAAIDLGVGERTPLNAVLHAAGIAVEHGGPVPKEGRRPIRMTVLPDGTSRLTLSGFSTLERDREDMARALGHHVMHAREGECMIVCGWADPEDEAETAAFHEAIWFMQGMLMPASEFGRPGADPVELARRHGVTTRAATLRVEGIAARAAKDRAA